MTVRQTIAVALERHILHRDPIATALMSGAVRWAEKKVDEDVDRLIELMHLDAFASETSEHRRVPGVASDDLREHSCHCANRQVASAHLGDQGPHAVAAAGRSMRNRGDGFAVEEQHQLARRRFRGPRWFCCRAHVSTSSAAHSSVSAGTGPWRRSSSASHSSTALR